MVQINVGISEFFQACAQTKVSAIFIIKGLIYYGAQERTRGCIKGILD